MVRDFVARPWDLNAWDFEPKSGTLAQSIKAGPGSTMVRLGYLVSVPGSPMPELKSLALYPGSMEARLGTVPISDSRCPGSGPLRPFARVPNACAPILDALT